MKNDRANLALLALLIAAVLVLGFTSFLRNVDENETEERFIFPSSENQEEII